MAIPGQSRIIKPLLIEIHELGGSTKPSELYERVAAYFQDMSDDERAAESESGHNIFENLDVPPFSVPT